MKPGNDLRDLPTRLCIGVGRDLLLYLLRRLATGLGLLEPILRARDELVARLLVALSWRRRVLQKQNAWQTSPFSFGASVRRPWVELQEVETSLS